MVAVTHGDKDRRLMEAMFAADEEVSVADRSESRKAVVDCWHSHLRLLMWTWQSLAFRLFILSAGERKLYIQRGSKQCACLGIAQMFSSEHAQCRP